MNSKVLGRFKHMLLCIRKHMHAFFSGNPVTPYTVSLAKVSHCIKLYRFHITYPMCCQSQTRLLVRAVLFDQLGMALQDHRGASLKMCNCTCLLPSQILIIILMFSGPPCECHGISCHDMYPSYFVDWMMLALE